MKSLELMILVGLLVTLGRATQVTQGVLMKRAPRLDGYKFTEDILWDAPAPSAGICSALCVRHHSCVSLTFDGSTCIGHSVILTSVSPSATPSAKARTFVKREADCGGKMCLNGGTLVLNTCRCTCPDLYTGDVCETRETDCGGKMCLNGGTLVLNTCTCTCPDLYTGDVCETRETVQCSPDEFTCQAYVHTAEFACTTLPNLSKNCPNMCGIC